MGCCYDGELYLNGSSILAITFIPYLNYHSYVMYIINPGTMSEQPGLSQNNILAIEAVMCDEEIVCYFNTSNGNGNIST